MPTLIRQAAAILLLACLSACQVQPVIKGDVDLADETWSLSGKLGVIAGKQRGSFAVDWRQASDHYEINLLGPLGVGVARIVGDGDAVVLERPGEAPIRANSTDDLLLAALGYNIPVTPMRFWIRGSPAPGRARATENGFVQAGWTVEYLEREQGLPTKVRLTRPEARLTMVVKAWNN